MGGFRRGFLLQEKKKKQPNSNSNKSCSPPKTSEREPDFPLAGAAAAQPRVNKDERSITESSSSSTSTTHNNNNNNNDSKSKTKSISASTSTALLDLEHTLDSEHSQPHGPVNMHHHPLWLMLPLLTTSAIHENTRMEDERDQQQQHQPPQQQQQQLHEQQHSPLLSSSSHDILKPSHATESSSSSSSSSSPFWLLHPSSDAKLYQDNNDQQMLLEQCDMTQVTTTTRRRRQETIIQEAPIIINSHHRNSSWSGVESSTTTTSNHLPQQQPQQQELLLDEKCPSQMDDGQHSSEPNSMLLLESPTDEQQGDALFHGRSRRPDVVPLIQVLDNHQEPPPIPPNDENDLGGGGDDRHDQEPQQQRQQKQHQETLDESQNHAPTLPSTLWSPGNLTTTTTITTTINGTTTKDEHNKDRTSSHHHPTSFTRADDDDDIFANTAHPNVVPVHAAITELTVAPLFSAQNAEKQQQQQQQPAALDISRLSRHLSFLLVKQLAQVDDDDDHTRTARIQQFLQDHVVSLDETQFVWNALLERMASSTNSSSSTSKKSSRGQKISQVDMIMRVAKTLLRQRVSSLAPFVQPLTRDDDNDSDDKKHRILALQATMVVDAALQDVLGSAATPVTSVNEEAEHDHDKRDDDDDDDMIFVTSLLQEMLPRLVVTVSSSPQRRTVLSQQCVQVAYAMMSAAVHLLVSNTAFVLQSTSSTAEENDRLRLQQEQARRHALMLSLWNVTRGSLVQLLQVHLAWIKPSITAASDAAVEGHSGTFMAAGLYSNDESSGTVVINVDTARKACAAAVLVDWQQNLQQYERRLELFICDQDMAPEEAMVQVSEEWCSVLAGVLVKDIPNAMGSFQQTMVVGSQPYTKHPNRPLTGHDILRCLQAATDQQEKGNQQQHSLLRGVAAWLGQSKKHVEAMRSMPINLVTDAAAIVLTLLNSENAACVNLASSILDVLWCDTNGLPPGIYDAGDACQNRSFPPCVDMLVDLLQTRTTKQSEEQSTSPVFCRLLARCMQVRGTPLLEYLLTKNGIKSNTTTDVLLYVVSKNHAQNDLVDCIGNHLVDNIPTSSYLRARIRDDKIDLSRFLTMESLIPKLLDMLEDAVADKDKDLADRAATVIFLLTNAMENNIHIGLDEFLNLVFDKLERNVALGASKRSHTKEQDKIIAAFGGSWRRRLISTPLVGRDGFAILLSGVARLFFCHPESTTPVKILGALVGQGLLTSGIDERVRCNEATMALLKECVQQLDTTSAESEPASCKKKDALFRRLSPLVCLRRVPTSYFQQLLYNSGASTSDVEVMDLFKSLALQLWDRFQNTCYTSDERRLAAEIAGQCLQFKKDTERVSVETCSSFHLLFVPATDQFHEGFESCFLEMNATERIRIAGAALYMVCHNLQHVAYADDDGEAILFAASFALEVFEKELDGDPNNPVDEEIVHLQSGCIEFLAVCIDTGARNRLSLSAARRQGLVEELDLGKLCSDTNAMVHGRLALKSLDKICSALINIASDGFTNQDWIKSAHRHFDTESGRPYVFSTQATICVWDAFIIASQRSQNDELEFVAQKTMSWIVDWAVSGKGRHAHQLCVAAALQLAFTLITRMKSFAFWREDDRHDKIRMVHMWALHSLKRFPEDAGSYETCSLRKAALKLMLAVVTIDQIGGSRLGACLAPGDLGETFSLLRAVGNMDPDPQVRQLADYILRAIAQR